MPHLYMQNLRAADTSLTSDALSAASPSMNSVTPAAVPGERSMLARELAAVADMRTYVWDAAA